MESTTQPTSDWRSLIKIHPAAEMFPELEGDEFRSLAKDIHQQGLKTAIHTWFDEDEQEWLLDGRNRLNVMEELGYRFNIVKTGGIGSNRPHLRITEPLSNKTVYVAHHFAHGRYSYVTSLNIHRRHLTTEQRKAIAAEIVKRQPERSDRSVAKETKLSPSTVGEVRKEVEGTVQTGQLETEPAAKRVGRDGKARKPPIKAEKATRAAAKAAKDAEYARVKEEVAKYKKKQAAMTATDLGVEALADDTNPDPTEALPADYQPAYLAPDVDRRTLPAYNFPEPSKKAQLACFDTYLSWPLQCRLAMRSVLLTLSDTTTVENFAEFVEAAEAAAAAAE